MRTPMHRAPRTQRFKEVRRHLFIYAGLLPFIILAGFPVLWMFITAFKQNPDLYEIQANPMWFKLPPTLHHFWFLF